MNAQAVVESSTAVRKSSTQGAAVEPGDQAPAGKTFAELVRGLLGAGSGQAMVSQIDAVNAVPVSAIDTEVKAQLREPVKKDTSEETELAAAPQDTGEEVKEEESAEETEAADSEAVKTEAAAEQAVAVKEVEVANNEIVVEEDSIETNTEQRTEAEVEAVVVSSDAPQEAVEVGAEQTAIAGSEFAARQQHEARTSAPQNAVTEALPKNEGKNTQEDYETPLPQAAHDVGEAADEIVDAAKNQAKLAQAVVNQSEARGKVEAVQDAVKPVTPVVEVVGANTNGADSQNGSLDQQQYQQFAYPEHALFGLGHAAPQAAILEAAVKSSAGSLDGSIKLQAGEMKVTDLKLHTETLKNAAKAEQKKEAGSPQAKMMERVQKVLEEAVRTKDSNTIIVRLDPPQLGALTVRLTHRGEELFGRIIPETPEAEAILRTRANELQQILAATGLKAENVHVSIGQERSADSFLFQQNFEGRGRQGDERGSSIRGGTGAAVPQTESRTSPREEAVGWIA
ncbi:MAG: flagellar hook-length control protein FliK [Bdellovibrionales bacterium]|nr:flagellar hook-length control protein FliK [Bdellovibrionales bacterium]